MNDFRDQIAQLDREDILEIIDLQDPELIKGIRRIEWVFENKLTHLTWSDGSPIRGRQLTNQELALLVDEPFEPSEELLRDGFDYEAQHQMHIAKDPVLWSRYYLKAEPRAYQIMMMRHPSLRKVLRAGRRLGKTFTMALTLLHYSFTHRDGRCIVVAPMKSHVELIYQELLRLAAKSELVMESITRNVTSPHHVIQFSNGSTIRFFTSGIRSGGKADVVRGQEAHVIVLDELDYMHNDDLESLYAMLQKTAEDQPDKLLIGASTPTGQRQNFWKWCNSSRFKEFWFPSYVNPFFSKEAEEEFREQYTEMGYRHEIEADWGEDTEGVYPRKYVDMAFNSGKFLLDGDEGPDKARAVSSWKYDALISSARSFFIFGVDWDKYGAGTNIVVLEVCDDNHEDKRFRGKCRVAYREEVKREEYTLTNAVDRIIQLNEIFKPKHIYVDRGFGEVQVELLHKYGVENPSSNLRKVVKGVSFSETIEIRDPASKEMVKKDLKPYMVDNLRQMLEKNQIVFSAEDDELYLQLISYVVVRTTQLGRPVFEAGGSAGDHAHDGLILAAFAYNRHYGELMRQRIAKFSRSVSNETFLNTFELSSNEETKQDEVAKAEEIWGSLGGAPVKIKRSMTVNVSRANSSGRPIRRKMF